jgi:hypothetical protein
MKLQIVILLMMLCGFSLLYGQDNDRFRNFHGIVVEGNHFFEAEGHDIFVRTAAYPLIEKGISKIIRQYDMKGSQRRDTVIHEEKAIVLVRKETQNGFELTSICYLLPKDDYSTTVIGLAGFGRNVSLEHFMVQAWLDKTIPDDVYTIAALGNSFKFMGRTVPLGGLCNWMSPHNIQCPNNGQMSWAIFDSEQAALANRDIQIAVTKNKSLTDIQEDTVVPVTFEGAQVNARKMKVKIKVPTLIMGGSNVLIVYYVVANIHNKYVTCVMSHYTDDAGGKTLAPLLREVMKLNE